MTDQQQEVLAALEEFWAINGYAPTVRQIADLMGQKSHTNVLRMLDALREEGLVEGKGRSLRAVSPVPPATS